MKVFLMFRDRDLDLKAEPPPCGADLLQDLELEKLFQAMSAADPFLLDVAKHTVPRILHSPDAILYRQHILADCQEHPEIIRKIYGVAVEAIESEKKVWGWMSVRYPEATLHRSIEVLTIFVKLLKQLRKIADEQGESFRSEGFSRLFRSIQQELGDEYLKSVEDHLRRLKFDDGILMSAALGKGNQGSGYTVRKPREEERNWVQRMQAWLKPLVHRNRSRFTYQIADRDEAGFRALSELRTEGIGNLAAALALSTDHILAFFNMLRLELGFYVSCLNLREKLAGKGEPTCLPSVAVTGDPALSARGLYDPCLSQTLEARAVGNDIAGDQKTLLLITGANRGGKSTLLRSLGLAQVMMQCGMFVPAEAFRASVSAAIFTHFKREEDATMQSGKLDEELRRMSSVIDNVVPGSVVLFNESFASTNEREGSEIARQIVRALLATGVKVYYVTHMFDLAESFYAENIPAALFLRAERLPDGRRTFRLDEGKPLPTSYGEDLYARIFGVAPNRAAADVAHPV